MRNKLFYYYLVLKNYKTDRKFSLMNLLYNFPRDLKLGQIIFSANQKSSIFDVTPNSFLIDFSWQVHEVLQSQVLFKFVLQKFKIKDLNFDKFIFILNIEHVAVIINNPLFVITSKCVQNNVPLLCCIHTTLEWKTCSNSTQLTYDLSSLLNLQHSSLVLLFFT